MHSKFKLFISAILCFTIALAASCSGKDKIKSAVTAFADTESTVTVPANSLEVVEALQNVFRSVSSNVLKSVVEVDVIETKTRPANPFEDLPFFFFGQPRGSDGNNNSREYKQSGLGSGVIVRRDGNTYYVLTNEHVAGAADEISVKLYDSREFACKLVGKDERKDIALVSFESKDDIPVATLGDSDKVQSGDICFAMGTPLGYFGSVTQGIVSATGRDGTGIGNISDFIQTDAAINQGNSGGPLVNIYGEIIGINTWIASQSGGSQGLGFAIPINNVKKAISEFIKDGKVTYGWMGVSLTSLDKDYEKALGIKDKKGAFVAQIFLNSPAAKGGIQAGDFIVALNGKPVKDVDQLVRDVGDLRVGETADFTVIRGGKDLHVSVKIEGRDDSVVTDNSKLWPGFIAQPLTDEIRKEMKLDNSVKGVIVTNVQAKSPAAALRIQNGDIITAVNGKPVANVSEFYNELVTKQKEIWFELYTSEGHKIETSRYRF